VSRWSQYSLNGYTLVQGVVLSGQPLMCSPTTYVPVFEVQLGSNSSNSTCLGVASLQQPALSLNDTITLIESVGTGFVAMFAPAVCVPYMTHGSDSGCSWNNVNLAYPSYSLVFVFPASAQSDAAYWLGLWIAFLLVFVLAAPVVLYGMIINCKDASVDNV
jgi:hypothetical protein